MIPLQARLDSAAGREWLRRAAWTLLALSLLAFVVRGANRPADPYLVDDPVGAGRRPLAGFGEIAFAVTDPAGATAEWCALLADAAEQRAQGLMQQVDLRGYDAMVFRYPEPIEGSFWMKDTLIPLTVAYFDAEGRFVSAADMAPCPPDAESCPAYPAEGPFLHAVEVPQGGLADLGIGPGATLSFPGGPCR